MQNRIYTMIALLGLFLGFAGARVQAQTPSSVEVNVPFEFSAGSTTLKPGVYTIKRLSGNLVTIRNVDDGSAAILNAPVTLGSTDPEAFERLVFNGDEDRYSLAQLWLTADSGREILRKNKTEKAERRVIALRRK